MNFKRLSVSFLLCLILFLSFSCSREKADPKTPLLENAVKISLEKDLSKIPSYYTEGTVKAARVFAEKTGGTDILSGLDRKLFVRGSAWDLKSEKKDGDRADVVIVITAHQQRNMIGYEASLSLKYEDGSWKLNREEYIRSLLKSLK